MNRDEFLDNVAARLGHSRTRSVTRPLAAKPGDRPGARDAEGQLQVFGRELERVGGRLLVADSLAALGQLLRAELEASKVRTLVSVAQSELAVWKLEAVLATLDWYPSPEQADGPARVHFRETALKADAGLTTVDYALVETGSLVITCSPTRPRSASLLPRLHLALVREAQLVESLAAAVRLATQTRLPSAIQIVTGPSRTSDIENDLTIGVHGPAAVCVLLLRDGRAGSRNAA